MKVKVKAFLTLKKVMGDESSFEFEMDKLTLNDLLSKLSKEFANDFREMIFDSETKTLNPHVRILINGRHYSHLPSKLNTGLQDGDEVALFPLVAGGLDAVS